jgi:hypothetical protein
VLRPLSALTIAVRDQAGGPIPSFTVRLVPTRLRDGMVMHPAEATLHEAKESSEGAITVPGLQRSHYDVHVVPGDERFAASGVLRIAVDAPHERCVVVLSARTERRLGLVFADGTPAVGARLELCHPPTGGGPTTYAVDIGQWRKHNVPDKALRILDATTDAAGTVIASGPAMTPLTLRVLGPGCIPAVVPLSRLDGDGPLVVTVRRGGELQCTVHPADVLAELAALRTRDHEPLPSVWVARPAGRGTERVPAGDASPVSFDAGGIARIRGVAEGTWTPHFEFANECVVLAPVAVREGETTAIEVDLTPMRPATLRGRVLRNGKPARSATVQVERRRAANERHAGLWTSITRQAVVLDDDGRFVLRTVPGAVRVLMQPTSPGDVRNPSLAAPTVELAAGDERDVEFTAATGTAAIRFVDAQQQPVAGVMAWLARADGYQVAPLPASDGDGRSRFDDIETGALHVFLLPRHLGDPRHAIPALHAQHPTDAQIVDRTRLELGPVVVRAGDPIEQTLVLPDAWFR